MTTNATTITRQDAAQALAIMLLVRDAAKECEVGKLFMHAERLPLWIWRPTGHTRYDEHGLVFAEGQILCEPENPADMIFGWRTCVFNIFNVKHAARKAVAKAFFSEVADATNELIPWLEHVGPTLPDAAAAKPGKRRGPKPATAADRHADSAIVKDWEDYCKKEADENDNRKPSRKAFGELKGITERQFKAIQDRVKARQKRRPGVGRQ